MRTINNVTSIGLISDTHIPTRARGLPGRIYELFNGVSLIIHCGDIVDNKTLDELGSIAPTVAVKGNMDPETIRAQDAEIFLINGKFRICVSHGSGSPMDIKQRLYKTFASANPGLICYGHTHVCSDETYNSIRFLNPGSATVGSRFNSIIILNTDKNDIVSNVIHI